MYAMQDLKMKTEEIKISEIIELSAREQHNSTSTCRTSSFLLLHILFYNY